MSAEFSRPEVWARLKPGELDDHIEDMSEGELREFPFDFLNKARAGQLPPEGDWHIWLMMAGRGFGKTRAGSEWVRSIADADPAARIARVGASLGETRAVMVEGESGIIACCPPDKRPNYEPSLRRISWPNGAIATLYSAAEPESLRGPQHSHAYRAGAEGIHRQRGAGASRRPRAPLRDRGARGSARESVGGRLLPGCAERHRRLGRKRCSACRMGRKPVDDCSAERGHACSRFLAEPMAGLFRRMAAHCRTRRA